MPRTVLFSIKPHYARAIMLGVKTIELRRVRVSAVSGDRVIIYASAPVMAVLGSASVTKVLADHPSVLWPYVERQAGVTAEEYHAYFNGAQLACAIGLSDVEGLAKPITLRELRTSWGGFQPPQSYRFLDDTAVRSLLGSGYGGQHQGTGGWTTDGITAFR